jgi:hypothetical protein
MTAILHLKESEPATLVEVVIYYLDSKSRDKDVEFSSRVSGQEEYEGKFGEPQSMRRIVPPK